MQRGEKKLKDVTATNVLKYRALRKMPGPKRGSVGKRMQWKKNHQRIKKAVWKLSE